MPFAYLFTGKTGFGSLGVTNSTGNRTAKWAKNRLGNGMCLKFGLYHSPVPLQDPFYW